MYSPVRRPIARESTARFDAVRRFVGTVVDWLKGCVENYPVDLCWECDHRQRNHSAAGCATCGCLRAYAFCSSCDKLRGSIEHAAWIRDGHCKDPDSEYERELRRAK
jgi:hypothetical protein